ncbi:MULTISPECIES: AGE family epimerase/isomerase [unclassified Oceanispirochaeta]|uniref:AGE family epimerase/isomerase n=1 Tax=unclassified Oceanispirochaeta TaxID=2635722 RepID=UPI000E09A828|nr:MULTISPECIES: AGE family epimerase/isomerase [unclassified Oceanispirochaeta]MBF9018464.1 AGE family epimerase/isomerase [Oceanispirochaeta sp. M2]NPD74870.1 N-acylglucosamine 2-epimerase [Oceanispirochaeta sp. M1]RDG29258.1 N-acylglucosamine 2-epimerase [Oceanispirochaeta sp. M1]
MELKRIDELKSHYYEELVNNIIPFWSSNSVDTEDGGFITYLNREGERKDTDKNGWVQGRMTWLYASLYNKLEKRPEWLEIARHGYEFLKTHIIDETGRGYFTVTKKGEPVRRRRYLFVEAFAIIGFAEYYKASGDKEALDLAEKVLDLVLELSNTPGALEEKFNTEVRQTRSHSFNMIMIVTLQVLRDANPAKDYNNLIDHYIDSIFKYFVHPEKKALLETVGMDGEFLDTPVGRNITPGHAIETSWFLLEEGRYQNNQDLINKALPILDWSLDFGWDKEFGGILNFVDICGNQAEQVDWDMKYWWTHNEAIYALLLAHDLTGEEKYEKLFNKVFDWAEKHFPDKDFGEWYGYLHRDGTVALDFKGNNWKGCFHLPRQQLNCYLLLKKMSERKVL